MVIFTQDYIEAKTQVLTEPTLKNWQSFETQFYALPRHSTNKDFKNPEALHATRERIKDFCDVARHVVSHLSNEEIAQSVSLTLAKAEFSSQ